MKWNSRRVSVWAYAAPTDLRKGFDAYGAKTQPVIFRSGK